MSVSKAGFVLGGWYMVMYSNSGIQFSSPLVELLRLCSRPLLLGRALASRLCDIQVF